MKTGLFNFNNLLEDPKPKSGNNNGNYQKPIRRNSSDLYDFS